MLLFQVHDVFYIIHINVVEYTDRVCIFEKIESELGAFFRVSVTNAYIVYCCFVILR